MSDAGVNTRLWSRHRMLAYLYDWEHDAFQDDVALYVELAKRAGGATLELACGTGRVLLGLARSCVPVVGLDRSPAMLARARDRLSAGQPVVGDSTALLPGVRLVEGDLRDALPSGPFALAVLGLDAFGLLVEPGAQLSLLQRVRDCLQSDGTVAVDVVHEARFADQPQGVPVMQVSGDDPIIGAQVTKWIVRRVLAASQIVELHLFYDVNWADGTLTRLTDLVRLRYFSRFEVELLLTAAGFKVQGVYGDYELGQLRDDSERVVILATPDG